MRREEELKMEFVDLQGTKGEKNEQELHTEGEPDDL